MNVVATRAATKFRVKQKKKRGQHRPSGPGFPILLFVGAGSAIPGLCRANTAMSGENRALRVVTVITHGL